MTAEVQSAESQEEVQHDFQAERHLEKVHFIDRHLVHFLQQGQVI